ncbi:MAG: FAD-dependent oxidoreductase [Pseudomonadota bacterium]
MALSVAIVGAGPGGFYAAEALAKADPGVQVDILEYLPTPYGLIRYGVAPDHEKTRRVARTFERTANREQVAYYGNVRLGRDLSLSELREFYDAVVLATGAPLDRAPEIPGAAMPGAYGAAEFVDWYNGHPDWRDLRPRVTGPAAAIIGNGNVALDLARILLKRPADLAATDIAEHAASALERSGITEVSLIGRRGPVEAKWTNVELREMGQLHGCAATLDPAVLPEVVTGVADARAKRLAEKNLASLRGFAQSNAEGATKRLNFQFYARPVEILGDGWVTGLRLERTRLEQGRAVGTGEHFELPCSMVLHAIGYRAEPIPEVPFDGARGIVKNDQGRVAPGVYAVGWIKRGPSGVIGTNKPDGDLVAKQIAQDITASGKPGRPALEAALAARCIRWIGFADWKRIEAAEVAAAAGGAPRRKFVKVEDMLGLLAGPARQASR